MLDRVQCPWVGIGGWRKRAVAPVLMVKGRDYVKQLRIGQKSFTNDRLQCTPLCTLPFFSRDTTSSMEAASRSPQRSAESTSFHMLRSSLKGKVLPMSNFVPYSVAYRTALNPSAAGAFEWR